MTPETTSSAPPVPRGRHAPPLEVRLEVQKHRLFDAAATVFSKVGYAEASAEAISRQAGMSKATFYEHFANKEECLVALFEYAAASFLEELVAASRGAERGFEERHSAGLHAILEAIEENPALAQAILIETVGAGPRLAELRIEALNGFAQVMYEQTVRAAALTGGPAFASPDEAFAIVGATFELVSRQLRTAQAKSVLDLQPLIERLIIGLLSQPPHA
ncbi:MAG TPA: TetR/AcrR family transcriptional regulator [Solirubrobacteraceae bacterium]|nr:TetR/AcrR family transcriptional regulator [Solirubrobacteraceae bacterium]